MSFQRLNKKKTTILFDVLAIVFFKNTSLHINAFNCQIGMEMMLNIFPHYFIQTIKVWIIRKINGIPITIPTQLLVHNSSSLIQFSTLLNCSLTILSGWPLLQIQDLKSFRWLVKGVSSEQNLLIRSPYGVHVLGWREL